MGVILRAHPVHWESHIQRNASREVTTISPPFYNELHRSHVLFVKSAPGMIFTSWSQHHFCCDSKARAAGVQSFTLWQQSTIEITRCDNFIIAFSRHILWVLFFAHIPFIGNRTFNAMPAERLQQYPLLFTTDCTDPTFFLWSLHLAWSSHPGHSTTFVVIRKPEQQVCKASHCGSKQQ